MYNKSYLNSAFTALLAEAALSEFVIEGVKTTIPFHLKLMDNAVFRSGKFTTKFLETSFDFSELK